MPVTKVIAPPSSYQELLQGGSDGGIAGVSGKRRETVVVSHFM